jgi:hypothetical protein
MPSGSLPLSRIYHVMQPKFSRSRCVNQPLYLCGRFVVHTFQRSVSISACVTSSVSTILLASFIFCCWTHWMYCGTSLRYMYTRVVLHSYRLDRVWHNISCDGYLPSLANAIHPIDGLRFRHRVPVRLHKMDMVSHCEVKSGEDD